MMERVVVFRVGERHATVATRLTNLSESPLTGVAWLENLDPDQGSGVGVGTSTSNDVVLGGDLVLAEAGVG